MYQHGSCLLLLVASDQKDSQTRLPETFDYMTLGADEMKNKHGLPDISLPFKGSCEVDIALAADSVYRSGPRVKV